MAFYTRFLFKAYAHFETYCYLFRIFFQSGPVLPLAFSDYVSQSSLAIQGLTHRHCSLKKKSSYF